MAWIDEVRETLAELGVEQNDVREMLAEWRFTGNSYDTEDAVEVCQLCGHQGIRYQFEIVNIETDNELLVGSECIKKFGISGQDEEGNELDADETERQVNAARTRLITDARFKRVINTLVELSTSDEQFDIDNFISYYKRREAFTPNQLKVVVWRLNEHGVEFKPTDFKMILRRGREQDQLAAMAGWQVKQIWPCMSPPQRASYIERFGEP